MTHNVKGNVHRRLKANVGTSYTAVSYTHLVTLEKPLNFGSPDNDPVSVALFLCAPNKDEHIQLLTDIATLFEDDEFLDAAADFESIEDVQAFLSEHLDEA